MPNMHNLDNLFSFQDAINDPVEMWLIAIEQVPNLRIL